MKKLDEIAVELGLDIYETIEEDTEAAECVDRVTDLIKKFS